MTISMSIPRSLPSQIQPAFRQAVRQPAITFGQTVDVSAISTDTKPMVVKPTKVSIVGGAGNVGASLASELVRGELCNEVMLIDMNGDGAKGKAIDLSQAAATTGSDTRVKGGSDYKLLENSDIVVVTAGSPRKPGMSRDDLMASSVKVITTVAQNIKEYAPNAMIIMVSNPLDTMTQLAQKVTGFPANRVFGMAGVLDSARFKSFIAEHLDTSVQNVNAMVIGEHGNSMVAVPSNTTVSGIPVTQLIQPDVLQKLIERTRNGGKEIVDLAKASSFYGPGAAIARMVKAVLKGKNDIIPVCAQVKGEYGVNGLYVGVPVVLGRNGVEKVIELKLDAKEMAEFQKSVAALRANVEQMERLSQPPVSPPAQ